PARRDATRQGAGPGRVRRAGHRGRRPAGGHRRARAPRARGGRLMRKALALIGVVAACTALAAPAEAAKPNRIVALTPFAANTLVRLGIKPVAVGKTPGNVKLHRKLRKVRKLPLSHASNGPNLEQLAQLDPDLVFSERTWKAGHSAIRQLGIKVT